MRKPPQRRKRGKHGLAVLASQRILRQGNKYVLPAGDAEQISASLKQLSDRPELKDAVLSLVDLAAHMDRKLGAPDVAANLLDIARTAVPAMRRANMEVCGALRDTPADSLRAFVGVQRSVRAPTLNSAAPAGAFRVSSFPRAKIR